MGRKICYSVIMRTSVTLLYYTSSLINFTDCISTKALFFLWPRPPLCLPEYIGIYIVYIYTCTCMHACACTCMYAGKDSLSPHEVATLQLCIASMTPSVASGFLETFLEHSDTHQSFQLLLRAVSMSSPLSPGLPSPMEMAIQQVH